MTAEIAICEFIREIEKPNDTMNKKFFLPNCGLRGTIFMRRCMKKYLIVSLKGGVSKTTSAIALATGLKKKHPEAKILLLETDPTGSIKTQFGLKFSSSKADYFDFLVEGIPLEEAINKVQTSSGEIDVVIASRRLADADVKMASFPRREETLTLRMKKEADAGGLKYDYLIIDSGPAMSLVLLNSMLYCDNWIIPITLDPFCISNIQYVLKQKEIIEEFWEAKRTITGILPTQLDKRFNNINYIDAIKQGFPDIRIFDGIPTDALIKRAIVKKQLIYDQKASKAGDAYLKFVDEIEAL